MNEGAIKFITNIVKPWELLNLELGYPHAVNPGISDFTNRAIALAVFIKHLPENLQKILPKDLILRSRSYEIMSDLADSAKHGSLRNPGRDCKLSVASMFERNEDAKVRFLRNVINIEHSTYGKIDFMTCSMEGALFVSQHTSVRTDWAPVIFNNSGEFSDEINVHASRNNQVFWGGVQLQVVRLNEDDGNYEPVDLNGTVKFTLTSEF